MVIKPCTISNVDMHVLCCAADVPKKTICSSRLSEQNAAAFRKAVQKHYWYIPTH